jgi:membrane protease YdiL (CAAX protease family)
MNFLELALGKGNQFWKYLFVMFLSFVVGAQLFGIIPLMLAGVITALQTGHSIEYFFANVAMMNFEALGMSSNMFLFLMLFTFVVGLVFLIVLLWLFHKRTYKETINGTRKIRWNRVWVGIISWGVLLAVTNGVSYAMNPEIFVLQFDIATFIPLLIIALILLPIQTSYEELLFRGYFAQGLAALTKSRWVAFIVPSVIFGLIHLANPEVKEFGVWIMLPTYILMGLVWGLISVLDDGIELALGGHAINNVFLALFFTHSSSALRTEAVFEITEINPVKSLIFLSICSFILVIFLARKYKWDFSILNKKVERKKEIFEEIDEG